MAKSRDWDELTWVWTEWRRKAGKPTRDLFEQLADLTNEAAKYNSMVNKNDLKFLINFSSLHIFIRFHKCSRLLEFSV